MSARMDALKDSLEIYQRAESHIYRRGDIVSYYTDVGFFKGKIVKYSKGQYVISDEKTEEEVVVHFKDIWKVIKKWEQIK